MRFPKLSVAIATVVFVSGCTAGRRSSVRMTEDVAVPPTHRSQYAPEYPSRDEDYNADPDAVVPRPLPGDLQGRVKRVSRSLPLDGQDSRKASATVPSQKRHRNTELPIREAGLIRWQSSSHGSDDCSDEPFGTHEGCHGQPAGTSFCHRLHLLFRPDCTCTQYDPWAFCGTMTFEESQAARRFSQPWTVPTPTPEFAPDRPQLRSAPIVPEPGAGHRQPETPPVPPLPDQEATPEMQPDEILQQPPVPDPSVKPNPADLIVPPEPPGDGQQPVTPETNEPSEPAGTPPKEGEYVEPPLWFRKKKQPAGSGQTSTEPAELPTADTTAITEALESSEVEGGSTSPEPEQPQEPAPAKRTPVGPTALPTPLRSAPRPGVARYPRL